MKRSFLLVATALPSLILAAPSAFSAGPYVFFGRDDSSTFGTSFPNSLAEFNHFTAHLTSFGVETADALVGVNPPLTFGATGITAATQGVLAQNAPGFQIGAQALLELDAAAPGQVDTMFTFNQPITAFGLYVIQAGDSANNNPITFRLENTITPSIKDVLVQFGPGWGADNFAFVGLGDTDPFNKVTLIETGDLADGTLYDNPTAGLLVPEPSSLALLAIGAAAAMCAAMRRRRRDC
jgi:hypothetical protein